MLEHVILVRHHASQILRRQQHEVGIVGSHLLLVDA